MTKQVKRKPAKRRGPGRPRSDTAKRKNLIVRIGDEEAALLDQLRELDPARRPLGTLCRDVLLALSKELKVRDGRHAARIKDLEERVAEEHRKSPEAPTRDYMKVVGDLEAAKGMRLRALHRVLVDLDLLGFEDPTRWVYVAAENEDHWGFGKNRPYDYSNVPRPGGDSK